MQFLLDKDPEVAAQAVRDKVSRILTTLPKDTDPPVIDKIATDASPVLNVVVASSRDLRETTKIVDDRIKKNIESLAGVGQVKFVGDRTRQIQIWLDGEKLNSYNINIEQVRSAVAAQNVEIPGGRVDQGPRELALRTMGRVERPEEFGRIIVASTSGSPIRVNDIRCDLLSISGHKIHAPQGVGALYVRKGTTLEPRFFGGPHAPFGCGCE